MAILAQILPIFLLLLAGAALRRFGVLSEAAIEGMKTFVVTLVVPSVLFTVFLDLTFEPAFLGLSLTVGALCIGLYAVGLVLGRLIAPAHPYFPFLFTGFEYGMLGVSLFGAAWGMDAVGYIAITDLAHELFIWFLFVPLLMIRRDGDSRPGTVLKMFATSPVVIGLSAGLVLGAAGLGPWVKTAPVVASLYQVTALLAATVVPLILVIVGYGIRIRRDTLAEVVPLVLARYALLIPLALVLNRAVIAGWLGLGAPYQAALFTLMVLPPSFIVPIFMQKAGAAERAYVNNALAVSTLVSLIAFSIYLAFNPVL